MTPPNTTAARLSPNFGHLAPDAPLLAHLGAKAEMYVFAAPEDAAFKLRQYGEKLAQEIAARSGCWIGDTSQSELLGRLRRQRVVEQEVGDLFHLLRRKGNTAAHEAACPQRDALHLLRIAWRLGVWFKRAFIAPGFKSGPFQPPPDPEEAKQALLDELAMLREGQAKAKAEIDVLRCSASDLAKLVSHLEATNKTAFEEQATAFELAEEMEAKAAQLEEEFSAALANNQAKSVARPQPDIDALLAQINEANSDLELDEYETRLLIDAQLIDAGWEADTAALRYAKGARPEKGHNKAIAEWPTSSGPADYILFVGLSPVAVVEAKRMAVNAQGAIEQAKRYSRDYDFTGEPPAGESAPWGDYNIPFMFSTNGRPYLKQFESQSGIWFLDGRRSTNHPRALQHWFRPEELTGKLDQDVGKANAALKSATLDGLSLRPYQRAAIEATDSKIIEGARRILLAMATGTGKTRTALALIYRLLKTQRFQRILFLVDRSSLGEQALGAFKEVQLEAHQTLTDIYDVQGLSDAEPEDDTRLHVATIQGMLRRLMYPSENDQKMPVGRYDCIIVDESHRGYNLDGGMTETDLKFRSQADYVSKYRQTLEYFDAVRIGLTATPAKHTSEIFGQPAYTYSYRQAVMDGFLVDHLPPFRIRTVLNQKGIRFEKGAEVQAYNVATKSIEQATMDDEVQFDVEAFNHRVISEAYTDAVCEALTKEIDPDLDDKTLIFCVDNRHADRVVTALKKAYGDVDDDLIQKITGKADKPLEKIRAFRNDPKPNIVVTVDLLTTGIDVPSIVNLVFLRAVRSRILYEQMIGRATRLCPDIGKEYFRIFDPVGIYTKLKDHTDMKPVVTRPSYPFAKLIGELLAIDDPKHQTQVVEELLGKFQAKRRHLKGAKAKVFETVTGQTPNAFATMLKSKDLAAIREALQTYPKTGELLDKLKPKPKHIYLAEDGDHFIEFERGYGDGNTKPEDYLDGFKTYLEQNKNQLTALLVVTQRPHDLTRWQLCELKLALDDAGYNEAHLRTAWHQAKNEEVAASIIGFIRQRALGSALVPYAHRVDRALAKILQSRKWTTPQRRWLDLIARQMKAETIVDRPALDQGQFKRKGGFDRINTRTFDGQLETILGDLHEAVWQDVG